MPKEYKWCTRGQRHCGPIIVAENDFGLSKGTRQSSKRLGYRPRVAGEMQEVLEIPDEVPDEMQDAPLSCPPQGHSDALQDINSRQQEVFTCKISACL